MDYLSIGGNSTWIDKQTQFQCLDYVVHNPRLHYMRLAISPILRGQATVIATLLRRAMLSKIQGAYISSARFEGTMHQYSTLPGIRESIHDIMTNLSAVVLQSDAHEPQTGYISFQGPGTVTADWLELPPSVQAVDKTQHIALVEQKIQLKIEVTVTRAESTAPPRTDMKLPFKDSVFLVNPRLASAKAVDYHIYSLTNASRLQELLIFEIWTDGTVSPEQLFYDAASAWSSLNSVLQPFLVFNTSHSAMPSQSNQSRPQRGVDLSRDPTESDAQVDTQLRLQGVSIDSLQLPIRVSQPLRKAGLHTVSQLASLSQEELLQLRQVGKESTHLIATALKERFHVDLPVSHN